MKEVSKEAVEAAGTTEVNKSSVKSLEEVRKEYAASLPEGTKEKDVKVRINGAKRYMRQIMSQFEGDVKSALEAIVGVRQRGVGDGNRANPVRACIAELVQNVSMSNVDCFMKFNKGPEGMRELMKYGVRNMPEAERVWIRFDATSSEYKVEAIGKEAPEGWDGYLPVKTQMTLS